MFYEYWIKKEIVIKWLPCSRDRMNCVGFGGKHFIFLICFCNWIRADEFNHLLVCALLCRNSQSAHTNRPLRKSTDRHARSEFTHRKGYTWGGIEFVVHVFILYRRCKFHIVKFHSARNCAPDISKRFLLPCKGNLRGVLFILRKYVMNLIGLTKGMARISAICECAAGNHCVMNRPWGAKGVQSGSKASTAATQRHARVSIGMCENHAPGVKQKLWRNRSWTGA